MTTPAKLNELNHAENPARDLHGDPADRLILATALEGHQLITADTRLLNWPGDVARLDARE